MPGLPSGINVLSYEGVESTTPPRVLKVKRQPTRQDYVGVTLGDFWLYINSVNNSINEVYILTSLSIVPGQPGRATWSLVSPTTVEFDTNNGVAVPVNGALQILGGVNMQTEATAPTGDTVAVDLIAHPILAGGLTITPLAGTGIVSTDAAGLFNSTNGTDGQIIVARPNAPFQAPVWADLVSDDASIIISASLDPLHPGAINLRAVGGGGGGVTKLQGDDGLTVTPDIVTSIIKLSGSDVISTYRDPIDLTKMIVDINDSFQFGDVIIGGGVGVASSWGQIVAGDASINVQYVAGSPPQIRLFALAGGGGITQVNTDVNNHAGPVGGIISILGAAPFVTTALPGIGGQTVQISSGAPAADGRVLISSAGGTPTWRTLTAGANVVITEGNDGAGQITISANGGGGGTGVQQFTCNSGVVVNPVTNIVQVKGLVGTTNVDHVANPYQNIWTAVGGSADLMNISLASSIQLPATNAGLTAGAILIGTRSFMHAYGTSNTFLGRDAGNTALTGQSNTCIGTSAGSAITTGMYNTFVGSIAGATDTTGRNNTLIGYNSDTPAVGTSYMTGVGSPAFSGDYSVAMGYNTYNSDTYGVYVGSRIRGSGIGTVAIGYEALSPYVGVPPGVFHGLHTLDYTTAIGYNAGKAYDATTSPNSHNNIVINSLGIANEADSIRIGIPTSTGSNYTSCHIGGIYSKSPAASAQIVYCDSTGKLGTNVAGNGYSFSAEQSISIPNITGDNTIYWLGINAPFNVIFDANNMVTQVGDAIHPLTITAPKAGHYFLGVNFTGYIATPPPPPMPTGCPLVIVTTAKSYALIGSVWNLTYGNPQSYFMTALANMAQGDTVTYYIQIAGSTKTIGAQAFTTYVYGFWVP